MTAIVIPLVRATAGTPKNAEHIQVGIAAELGWAGEQEPALGEVEGAAVATPTWGESADPTQSLPAETLPTEASPEETLAPEDPLAEGPLIESSPTETLITETLLPETLLTDALLPEKHGGDADLWLYRDRTVGLLRRYLRLSVEVGRLPSLLGREFFRTRVTSYQVTTFEDVVIFVHDVERCLEKLDDLEKKLITKIVFQDHTQDETARLLGCWRRTVGRRFPEALDRLSDIFLQGGLLERLPAVRAERPEGCQEGKTDEILVSDSEQGK